MNGCRNTAITVYLFVLICLLSVAPSTSSGEERSFPEALKRLYETSEALKAAREETDQRKYEKAAARGLYFPRVQFGMKYTQIDDPIVIDLNDIRSVIMKLHPAVPSNRIPSFELTVQDDTFLKGNINAIWPVFTGGQIIAANKAAKALLTDAKEKQRSTESVLIGDLVRRYFGLKCARKVSAVRKEVLKGMEQHLRDARSLEENGMISKGERLHAEVAWAEADREYRRAVRDEELAQAALNIMLSEAEPVEPTTSLFLVKKYEPLDYFLTAAREHNPILKQINAQKDAAHQSYMKEIGAMLPQVSLFGQYELHRHDLTIMEPKWAVGIGVTLPLFEGGSRINRIESAKSIESRVSYLKAQAGKDIEVLVQKRYQELGKALEQFEMLETSLASAREHLRIRMRSFEEGYATSTDVVDARLALSRVQLGRLAAAYDFDVALAELLEVCGMAERFEEFRSRADMEVLF